VPRSRRDSYHHGQLREALIREALALLRAKGIHGLTLREAARRAGVSQAAPYRHFADKEALLAAVAEEGFRRLGQAIGATLSARQRGPGDRLRAGCLAYVRFACENPGYYEMMFGPDRPDIERYPALHEAAHVASGHVLAALVDGQRAGVVRQGDLFQMALFIWTCLHGLADLMASGFLPVKTTGQTLSGEAERFARAVVAQALGALVPGADGLPAQASPASPQKRSGRSR
jgi:AcrR family transcriptional regulator